VAVAVASALLGAMRPAPVLADDAAERSRPVVPAELRDVRGERVDVAALASHDRLVFVTLKATWCGVCRQQLARLRAQLARLRGCGATFVVLSPGPRDALRQIAETSDFPYPFVEDEGLALARSADLVLAPDQIVPALFAVNARREIVWLQRGRSGASFGDEALLEHLDCAPLHTARSGTATKRRA
jgi:peroxiredoxin